MSDMINPPRARVPDSTYRLQFNGGFRFADAKELIPYLSELGISDIYSSPCLESREGSLHGYDIVRHDRLNPEIGSEDDFSDMVDELRRHGMGQIFDIVPNHMCIAGRNEWWMDVLENGPSSVYNPFFDIDWDPVKKELKDKVLIPILGDQYGNVLENKELQLSFENGAFYVNYYRHRFPIIPRTYINILEHRIDSLKDLQAGDGSALTELMSIITALKHLPHYTETDPEKVAERSREKEIIKKRLISLYDSRIEIREFINENIRIFNGTKEEPKSFDLLDDLLDRQAYRLSYWRVASEEINYRRFFDINELAAIRVEDAAVFEEVHRLVFRFIREGKVTGLRIDHPDGLYNPAEYFHRLQKNCFINMRLSSGNRSPETAAALSAEYDRMLLEDAQYKPFYIVGEKILIKAERMPEDWPIFSTTGYVFMNSVNGIFIDSTAVKHFDKLYEKFAKTCLSFHDIAHDKKKLITEVAMASEVYTLGHILNKLSEKNRHTRDFTLNSLTSALIEIIAFFPVYRTYITGREITDRDSRYVDAAISRAKRNNPAISESIFDFIRDVLLLNYPGDFSESDKREWLDFVMRFQQITGPVMAKGLEDTTFYVYNRLVSLNEVGGHPDKFGTSLETFHGQNIERIKCWPHAMIATTTHDTKRSEDVRARINVLSEIPEEWKESIAGWSRLNKGKKTLIESVPAPDWNEEYLLYQTLVGAWPVADEESTSELFRDRIKEYMIKAAREAKINTSWINPVTVYEEALNGFIDKIFDPSPSNRFIEDFSPFRKKISRFGFYNSLSQTLLKVTSPGVPDFYQGTELWSFTLVDPDNRRPVDFGLRRKMLEELKERESRLPLHELARELTLNMDDGRIKLYLTRKALNFRREHRGLFMSGEYTPIQSRGNKSGHVCSFLRRDADSSIIVVTPRFLFKLLDGRDRLPLGREVWEETEILLPEDGPRRYLNIFTGEVMTAPEQGDSLKLSEVLLNFPAAILKGLK